MVVAVASKSHVGSLFEYGANRVSWWIAFRCELKSGIEDDSECWPENWMNGVAIYWDGECFGQITFWRRTDSVLDMLSLTRLLYFQVEVLSRCLPCMNLDFRIEVWAGDINLVVYHFINHCHPSEFNEKNIWLSLAYGWYLKLWLLIISTLVPDSL